MMLGKGKHGQVFSHENGLVTKFTDESSEVKLIQKLSSDVSFKYVANYVPFINHSLEPAQEVKFMQLSVETGECYYMLKEELQHDDHLPAKIKELENAWDDSLVHSQDLFAFINSYLESDGAVPFEYMRAVITFHRYLYVEHKTMLPILFELAELVQELKSHNIYFIDWNEANFGLRNNHLALFELGGAKVKL